MVLRMLLRGFVDVMSFVLSVWEVSVVSVTLWLSRQRKDNACVLALGREFGTGRLNALEMQRFSQGKSVKPTQNHESRPGPTLSACHAKAGALPAGLLRALWRCPILNSYLHPPLACLETHPS